MPQALQAAVFSKSMVVAPQDIRLEPVSSQGAPIAALCHELQAAMRAAGPR
ncbi:hypothetical protein BIWAKO_05452 [Bosea sp. BIWAKO-01]|nr:hypothetical protein BIWAKO_05452 [Bosea sp. BIWAKO-01]